MSGYTAEMTELYTAEPETEPHIVIAKDKTVIVPEELRAIATQFEKNIETVTFDCPRYWDEHDLSEMRMYINFRRADGVELPHLCGTPTVDEAYENIVHFDWTVGNDATAIKGKLSFVAVAKKADENGVLENRWASRLCQDMEILEGIEPNYAEILEPSADIIEQLLYKLDAAAAVAVDAAERAIAAAQSATVVNPNLIDNWYFADPVNQRGQTEYYSGQKSKMYTIDRWYFDAWYRFAGFVDTGVYLATKSSESGEIEDAIYGTSMYQIIDNLAKYEGRKATLSAVINGELRSQTGTIEKNTITIPGSGTIGNATLSWDENLQAYKVSIYATTRNVIFEAIKLELGDKQTLAHRDANGNWVLNEIPDKGAELAKCQRYQLPLFGSIGAYGTLGFARVSGVSVKTAEMIVPIPVTMRATPTLTIGSAAFQMFGSETDYASVTAVTFSAIAPGFARLLITASKEMTAGAMYVLRKTTDDLVLLDANL